MDENNTAKLASKLHQNWAARNNNNVVFKDKQDDLTSLSWLQDVSIFPNVIQQAQEKTQIKKEELENKKEAQILPLVSEQLDNTKKPKNDINNKDNTCLNRMEHCNDWPGKQVMESDVLSAETTRQILNKKIQIQQRTSVQNLCLHYSYLSKRLNFPENCSAKPPYSYAALICLAMATNSKKLTLNQIYNWIREKFAFYRQEDQSWMNSIRHNLSLNKCFRKVARGKMEQGKGGFWEIDPNHINHSSTPTITEKNILEPDTSKRRRRRKNDTPIQYNFTNSSGKRLAKKSKPGIQSPWMPSSATASEDGISLTYSLPQIVPVASAPVLEPPQVQLPVDTSSVSSSPVIYETVYTLDNTSLPVLTVIKNNIIQSFLSFTTPLVAPNTNIREQTDNFIDSSQIENNVKIEDNEANKNSVETVLKSLSPVCLGDIPPHMLSTPPPTLDVLPRPTTPITVPSLSTDDDILDSLSTSLDMPLYSYSFADWPKMTAGGQEVTNEAAASESSLLDQSWDETQTLPLFEPTLDFETLMEYD